jgi:hypothetical protein
LIDDYIVIALSESPLQGSRGCSVIPAMALYPPSHRQVFGPASRADCQNYISNSCVVSPVWAFEDVKSALFSNLNAVKSSGEFNLSLVSDLEGVLNDWCGTPPRLPDPWNPDRFLLGVESQLLSLGNNSEEKLVREVVRVVWNLIKPSTAHAPTHDGNGNLDK